MMGQWTQGTLVWPVASDEEVLIMSLLSRNDSRMATIGMRFLWPRKGYIMENSDDPTSHM